MAGSNCTVLSLLTLSNKPITMRTRSLLVRPAIASPKPSKIRLRKNYLRPKILKTLTKPHPTNTPLLPQEPPPQQPVEEDDLYVEIPADETHGENVAGTDVEGDRMEELQVSEVTGGDNGFTGKLSGRSIFKYGIYLVGAFVFQTICTVWILGNDNVNQSNGDLEMNGKDKKDFSFNGNGKTLRVANGSNVFYLEDQFEMEKKIEEIRLMAREARKIEEKKKEEEVGDPEIDDKSDVSSERLGIEKEISARLLKLQNRINTDKDKSAALHINRLENSVKSASAKDNIGVNQGNEALIIKKKLKFKSPSFKQTKFPKGFPGIQDRRASDTKIRNSAFKGRAQRNGSDATDIAQVSNKQVNQQGVETQGIVSSLPLEVGRNLTDEDPKAILNSGKNLKEKIEIPNEEADTGVKTDDMKDGGVQEPSFGIPAVEVIVSRESREGRTQNSHSFVEENRDTGPIVEKGDVLSINGSSRHGLAKNISAANKAKQENSKTDIWWLNLRYVLVILMQRGSNGEGPGGLYSLKLSSQEQDQSDNSYTVAFEDHADANNFCFLLGSVFEDLGDFSADAVPMSVQELNEEVNSHARKVVVVKKRQLQLYAGQPLSDVETALCSIIKGQNVL